MSIRKLAATKVTPAAAAGSITVAVAGVSTVMSVDSAREWFKLMTEYLPLVVSLGMAGMTYFSLRNNAESQRQHSECQGHLTMLREQMRAVYMIVRRSIREDDALPPVEAFANGEFEVSDIERAIARRNETPAAPKKSGRRKADKPAKPAKSTRKAKRR